MFSHVDFAPTLLGLAGVKGVPGSLGTDLSGALAGGRSAMPDSVFLQIFGPFQGDGTEDAWRGIRTQRYTYARMEKRPWVLYDNQADPYQQKNLIDDRSSKPLVQELEKTLQALDAKDRRQLEIQLEDPVEDEGRLYTHGTFTTVEEYVAWERQHPEALKEGH